MPAPSSQACGEACLGGKEPVTHASWLDNELSFTSGQELRGRPSPNAPSPWARPPRGDENPLMSLEFVEEPTCEAESMPLPRWLRQEIQCRLVNLDGKLDRITRQLESFPGNVDHVNLRSRKTASLRQSVHSSRHHHRNPRQSRVSMASGARARFQDSAPSSPSQPSRRSVRAPPINWPEPVRVPGRPFDETPEEQPLPDSSMALAAPQEKRQEADDEPISPSSADQAPFEKDDAIGATASLSSGAKIRNGNGVTFDDTNPAKLTLQRIRSGSGSGNPLTDTTDRKSVV